MSAGHAPPYPAIQGRMHETRESKIAVAPQPQTKAENITMVIAPKAMFSRRRSKRTGGSFIFATPVSWISAPASAR
jgi:hypothetical protein